MASLKDIRNARQKSLAAARQKLEGMLASRRQLQVEVENLEARLQMIAAAKATSNYQFDDSRLGRVKELVSNLRNRLEVAEKLVNAEVYYHDEIPLDKATPENIVEQVSEHFAPKTPPATRTASTCPVTGTGVNGRGTCTRAATAVRAAKAVATASSTATRCRGRACSSVAFILSPRYF
jgi:dGTP triphosphohydrolase